MSRMCGDMTITRHPPGAHKAARPGLAIPPTSRRCALKYRRMPAKPRQRLASTCAISQKNSISGWQSSRVASKSRSVIASANVRTPLMRSSHIRYGEYERLRPRASCSAGVRRSSRAAASAQVAAWLSRCAPRIRRPPRRGTGAPR
jgi:hypothetical protein